MNSIILKSESEMDTRNIASEIAKYMFQGVVVALEGDLGVGKTQFTQSFCETLGVNEPITSPTFTIVNEYNGNLPVYHFDTYRINDIDELYDIGFEEYIYGQGVSIIEWADMVRDVLPKENLWVNIVKTDYENFNLRDIIINGNGLKYEAIVDNLKKLFKEN